MSKTRFNAALAFLSLALLAGCEAKEEAPPPEQVVPVPPTAAEIQQELTNAVQPVVASMQKGEYFNPAQIEPNLKNLQAALAKHRGTPNAQDAIKTVAGQLKDYVRQAHREKKAWYVMYFFDALKLIDPASTKDVERIRQEAQLIIDRPKPRITGFWKDEGTGQTTVFLEITIPSTGAKHEVRAREGDEFDNLRLVEIVGDNKCVKFEYLVNQDTFEVCTSAARQSQ